MPRIRPLPPVRVNLENPSVVAILQAAERSFAAGGFHATSLRQVAAHAGVSKALIHYHFDSKESLFLEMLGWLYRELAEQVETVALHQASPGIEAAERALSALSAAMRRLAPLAPVFAEVGVVALQHSALRSRTQTLLEETRALVLQSITHILGDEGLRTLPAPPQALAQLIHSCLHGIALGALYDESAIDIQLGALRALILAALGAATTPRSTPPC